MVKNKGFILIMTLVMALVMLIICFVRLKIFLAPYVAIQSDIIKKKEFYMADTAIEVIREQISNIFYDYVDSKTSWEVQKELKIDGMTDEQIAQYMEAFAESDQAPYYILSLKQHFFKDKATVLKTLAQSYGDTNNPYEGVGSDILGNDDVSKKFVAKYNGDLFNDYGLQTTLPSTYTSIGNHHKLLQISPANIKKWETSQWNWLIGDQKPSKTTLDYKNNVFDNKIFVIAAISKVRIKNDSKFSKENESSLKPLNIQDDTYLTYSDMTSADNFLPKELQTNDGNEFNGSKLYINYENVSGSNPTENQNYIKEHIKRRDYVIVAVSSYTGSDIKCIMKYYFSLISLSPNTEDHASFWGTGVEAKAGTGKMLGISQLRPIYRLYFRKIEYYWTEEEKDAIDYLKEEY